MNLNHMLPLNYMNQTKSYFRKSFPSFSIIFPIYLIEFIKFFRFSNLKKDKPVL